MKIRLNKDGKKRIGFIVRELEKINTEITLIYKNLKIDMDDQYQRINVAYFGLFKSHFDSFKLLIKNDEFNSSIVIARTMLELYVRCFYLEFIEKPKGSDVIKLLNQKDDFSSFFKMSTALDNYEHTENGDFQKHFKQYTKQGMTLYEKYSKFTHGRGEIITALYKANNLENVVFAFEDIEDSLLTIKGMYETFALQFLYVQGNEIMRKKLADRMIQSEITLLSKGIGQPDYITG
ncbi:hypothetical protein [Acinetobacter sp.]|uniref:hypothetical protein n=1 Tax=Acinetobacter sp. TaxID=472 RepID=UPI003BB1953D